MMRIVFGVVLAAVALAAAAVFGGSFIQRLGGDGSLTIDGAAAIVAEAPADRRGWPSYGGDAGGTRYSSLAEINRDTVTDLRVAWRYSTGDLDARGEAMNDAASEATPILAGDALVFCTPFNEVIALDPATGAEKWRHDPAIDPGQQPANQFVCRGVAYAEGPPGADCFPRILTGTNDGRLIALDAGTGSPCAGFGAAGTVRIDPGMDLRWPGEFQITSPPAVVGATVIVGSAISDNVRRVAPHGSVRAFDLVTGRPKWSFDPIPRTADAEMARDWRGEQPPPEGHANVWAPMAVDGGRGLVFLPTSSPSPDFFGGLRPGDNRHANSVVALDGETGAVRWAFQTVHHDVWDYDLPAQPSLVTITTPQGPRDAVVQVTKTGLVFVLDRDTGAPIIPVEERAVPQGGAAGEALSPTQPFPVAPPPLVPDRADPEAAFGLTWFDRRACRKAIAALDADGLYTPPSERGALVMPFTGGGANWGGAAFDPARNLLVVNMSNLAHRIQLIPAAQVEEARAVLHDSEIGPQRGAPFGVRRDVLVSPLGLPCTPPPWGVLAAVDLADGAVVWRRPLGTIEDLSGGLVKAPLGTPNFGGPVATAGGLVFIGATLDDYLRAFDIETGEELWRARLPAGGQATPMTYEWKGRQYVAIYAGGHARAGSRLGDEIMAFALPD